jgi:hypothetical protein
VTVNGVQIEIEDDRTALHVREALIDLLIDGRRFAVTGKGSLPDGSMRLTTTVAGPGCDLVFYLNEEAAEIELNSDWSYAMIAWAEQSGRFEVWSEDDTERVMDGVVRLQAIEEDLKASDTTGSTA